MMLSYNNNRDIKNEVIIITETLRMMLIIIITETLRMMLSYNNNNRDIKNDAWL